VSIPIAFLSAPIGTISPVLAMGMFPALFEAWIHKPRVEDFQNLMSDVASLKGFYKNKITHILLVFIMSSLGGAIGNIISVPTLAMHLK
ncbi:MAG TPA: TraB family protein, partial [Spirochaetia bacterium]|nr:TraB family protein [Spirochaetia bacterium]